MKTLIAGALALVVAYPVVSSRRTRAAEEAGAVEARRIVAEIAGGRASASSVNSDSTPYYFKGADAPGSCIIASAERKTLGPKGTHHPEYSRWGVCASDDGKIAPYDAEGNCVLDCRRNLIDALSPRTVNQ